MRQESDEEEVDIKVTWFRVSPKRALEPDWPAAARRGLAFCDSRALFVLFALFAQTL